MKARAITALTLGIALTTGAATAAPFITAQLQVNPQQLKPQTNPKLTPQLKPGIRPQGNVCEDPTAARLSVYNVRKQPNGTYDFTLQGWLRNIGDGDYRSRPGQQGVAIMRAPIGGTATVMNTWDFPELRAGGGKTLYATRVRGWNPSTEFHPDFLLRISYDPDIRSDGNPANDDCNLRNNEYRLRGVDITRELLRRG